MAVVKKCRHERSEWPRCECQWYWDHRVNGRRVYEPISAPDAIPEAGKTFARDADEWLKQFEPTADHPERRRNTWVTYRGYVKRLKLMFGEWRTRDIDGETLDAFSRDAEAMLAPTTASQLHGVLVRIIAAQGLDVPKHLPPKYKKPPKRMPVTTAEVRKVIASLPPRTSRVAQFVALTGVRLGEALGLKPEDIDGDIIWIRRQRGEARRTWAPKSESGIRPIALGPATRTLVENPDGEFIFEVTPSTAQTHFREALTRLGMWEKGAGFHTLRHYNASLRERVGQGLRGAQAELGHSNLSETLGYGWGEASSDTATQLEDYFHE